MILFLPRSSSKPSVARAGLHHNTRPYSSVYPDDDVGERPVLILKAEDP